MHRDTGAGGYAGSDHVPDCLAHFERSACFVPPDGGELVAGQVEGCPADDPVDCPEGGIAGDENDVMRRGDGVDQLTANDGNSDALHGGDDCDGAGGLFDQGFDTLLSIEQPNDVRIIPLP